MYYAMLTELNYTNRMTLSKGIMNSINKTALCYANGIVPLMEFHYVD